MVKVGDLCFVKVRGYSPWPARVNLLPNDVVIPNGKIPVFFYGTHEVSFVPERDIFEYEKYKNVYGLHKPKNIKFNQGMKELEDNPKVLQFPFDKGAISFLSQFYKFNKKSAQNFNYENLIEQSKGYSDSTEGLDDETTSEISKEINEILIHDLRKRKSKKKCKSIENINQERSPKISKKRSKSIMFKNIETICHEKTMKISEKNSACDEFKIQKSTEKKSLVDDVSDKIIEEKISSCYELKNEKSTERESLVNDESAEITEKQNSGCNELKNEKSTEKKCIESLVDNDSNKIREEKIHILNEEIKKENRKEMETLTVEIKKDNSNEKEYSNQLNEKCSEEKYEKSDYETRREKNEEIEEVVQHVNTRKRFRSSSNSTHRRMVKRICSVMLNDCLESSFDCAEIIPKTLTNDIVTKADTTVSSIKESRSDDIRVVSNNDEAVKHPNIYHADSEVHKCLTQSIKRSRDLEEDLSLSIQSSNLENRTEVESFKSPLDPLALYSIQRDKAMRLHDKFKTYLIEHAHFNHSSDHLSNEVIRAETRNVVKRHSSHRQKRKKEVAAASVHRSQTFIQPSIPTIFTEGGTSLISDADVYGNRSDEKKLRIISKLSVIDKEIKRSLIVGQENHSRCIHLMMKLEALKNLKLIYLCKVPDIVTTMRKCRRYKKNDLIRSSATSIYQRFYHIYRQSDIEEKSEGGAELLRRDNNNLKSAQKLLDEVFVSESKSGRCKSLTKSSQVEGSARVTPSLQSPSVHTATLSTDHDSAITPEHIIMHINDLLKSGSLQLIEVYESHNKQQSHFHPYFNEAATDRNEMELYKKLGV